MDRVRHIFFFISFGLSFFFARGQQIGNYITNGSFETLIDCNSPQHEYKAIGWTGIDSTKSVAPLYSGKCGWGPSIPGIGYQVPKEGKCLARCTWYYIGQNQSFTRSNLRNRLKQELDSGKTYCVKMYVSMQDVCPIAIDGFGLYFGDATIDTIKHNARLPLTFLAPQISNPTNNIISDSINWTPITGTFVANGHEKYVIVTNFKSNANTNTLSIGVQGPGHYWSEYFIDAVSCVELNLAAYAGPDQLIFLGDSAFIGRPPDFATDSGCIWYELPNMTTAIDTISGLWVKPTTTSTYVVRQELDCSSVKWDTVVVTVTTNPVRIDKLRALSDGISLFPNPTSGNLNISFSSHAFADFSSFSIFNSLGQIMREEELLSNTVDIGTSDLAPGLYEIHFKSQFGTVTKKFVRTD